ncbi:hypothetical protein RclHR1_13550002 [Rhizophagus clarus]|uniref:Uncharacterized protein n=1 Tax=Rhizophagus clarus TaxID=94130 RepID=A0A2Z6QQ57_9GLOM|nr:hypothetical protein RclHR1_13550002 [Rhizophagus clarus]GES83190.1 hypothetical protein RCL_jg15902.t1 [Rhizophagus clarus]
MRHFDKIEQSEEIDGIDNVVAHNGVEQTTTIQEDIVMEVDNGVEQTITIQQEDVVMEVDNGKKQTFTLQEDVVSDNLFPEFDNFYPFQNNKLIISTNPLPNYETSPNCVVTVSNLPVSVESSPNCSLRH